MMTPKLETERLLLREICFITMMRRDIGTFLII